MNWIVFFPVSLCVLYIGIKSQEQGSKNFDLILETVNLQQKPFDDHKLIINNWVDDQNQNLMIKFWCNFKLMSWWSMQIFWWSKFVIFRISLVIWFRVEHIRLLRTEKKQRAIDSILFDAVMVVFSTPVTQVSIERAERLLLC